MTRPRHAPKNLAATLLAATLLSLFLASSAWAAPPVAIKAQTYVPADGQSLILTFDQNLQTGPGHEPSVNDFELTVESDRISFTQLSFSITDFKVVALTGFPNPIYAGQYVELTYTDPTAGDNVAALQNPAGEDVATFTFTLIRNDSAIQPPGPPTVVEANVDTRGGELNIRFNKTLDTGMTAASFKDLFSINLGTQAVTFDSYLINGDTVHLQDLTPRIQKDQTPTVTYRDPTARDDTVAVQDLEGLDAGSFTTGIAGVPAVTNRSTFIANTVLTPTVYGIGRPGETLSSPGRYLFANRNADPPPAVTYTWHHHTRGINGAPISGETSHTYDVRNSDVGKSVAVRIQFTEDGIAKSGYSDPVRINRASTPSTCPAFSDPTGRTRRLSATMHLGTHPRNGDRGAHGYIIGTSNSRLTPPGSTGSVQYLIDNGIGHSLREILGTRLASRGLEITLNPGFTPGQKNKFQFHACGETYLFSEAYAEATASGTTYIWGNAGVDWSGHAGSTIDIFFTAPGGRGTGGMTLQGTPRVGETLTATASFISDPEGPRDTADGYQLNYQWYRYDADGLSNPQPIPGANDTTYTITLDDVGKRIRVHATFLDGNTNLETISSHISEASSAVVPQPQRIILSASELSVDRGGYAEFTVRLARNPGKRTPVSFARDLTNLVFRYAADGDTVTGIYFDDTDWNIPVGIRIHASSLLDIPSAQGTVQISGNADEVGPAETIAVHYRNTAGAGTDWALRLEGSDTPGEGRLEVALGGQWGTVCDDRIHIPQNLAPTLACRIMGYEGGYPVTNRNPGNFNQGDVPIHLDDLVCLIERENGDVSIPGSLSECERAPAPNCTHAEDLWLKCSGTRAPGDPVLADAPALNVQPSGAKEGQHAVMSFRVTLSPALTGTDTVTFDYATEDGTATAPVDYIHTTGTATFSVALTPPHANSRDHGPGTEQIMTTYVNVPIINDGQEDHGEEFYLQLSNIGGTDGAASAQFLSSRGTGAIYNTEVLEGEFTGLPTHHQGQAFTVELLFNDGVAATADRITAAITAAGGTVTSVTRSDETRSDSWQVTIRPDDGTTDVTLGIPEYEHCAASEAICRADNAPLSSPISATIPAALALPTITGPPQVGNTLRAAYRRTPDAWQWLRGGQPIAGATARNYVVTAADTGSSLSVRATLGQTTLTSRPTAAVWPAAANPQLQDGERELLATVLTLGSSRDYPLAIAGYNQAFGTPFGDLTYTAFDDDGTSRTIDLLVVNRQGSLNFMTWTDLPATENFALYWNAHRVTGFQETPATPMQNMLTARTPLPASVYRALTSGAADGVQVAVSIRRTGPQPTPEPLAAAFLNLPDAHGGNPFTFELAFTRAVAADTDALTDALSVTGGEVTAVAAVGTDAKRFEVTVEPAGTEDVTVRIGPTTDCTATNAVCTAGQAGLERTFETTVEYEAATLAAPSIAGAPQVGATLEASFAETPEGTLAWQWLRGEEAIAGAQAATYAPVAADVGTPLAVRVSRGEETATSEPTAPVWAAPANPPLAPGEKELLSATLTLGASDEFPLRMGGYNRFVGGPFGEMDETSFDEGARRHVVEMVMLNELGRLSLATQGPPPPAGGLAVYWNTHRIAGLKRTSALPGRDMLAGPSGIPRETYLPLADGTAEGVKVAVSVRRTHAVVSVTGASVTTGPGDNGTWDEYETVEAALTFSAPVTVSGGPPTLAVMLDGTRREATYSGGSGTDTLTFTWTVTEPDAGAKRARVASNGLALNGATLGAGSNTVVDTGFAVAPWVTEVAIAPDASGDREWTAGETIEARLRFSEPVTVADGRPWLELRIGGFAHPGTLAYASGSGSATLVFATEVPAGASGFTGLAVVADSLEANGASLASAASGLAAELGHDGTEPTAAPGESGPGEPLTAAFHDVPASHDGSAFTLELRFGEPVPASAAAPDAFAATGATVGAVSARDDRTWRVAVTPEDGASAVTVTLPARDCAETGAVCTADGRGLAADVSASVAARQGEVAFRLDVADLPEEHDGASDIVFRVVFNKRPAGFSYTVLRDATLRIHQGGTRIVPAVKRVRTGDDRNSEWRVTVTPGGREDVTVAIGPFSSCADTGAICTEDEEWIANRIDETVLGPPGLSVADARVYEAPGATVDFPVTLARASRATVTVDYATSDGTGENVAHAGADYEATSGTLAFAPGETEHTVSVLVYQDGHDEGEETFTLTLSNPQGGNAWLADATAIGTIENTDHMPKAWLARFGRTVAEQMVDAVDARFAAGRTVGVEMTLAGQPLAGASPEEIEALEERAAERRLEAFAERLKGVTGDEDEAGNDERALTGRDFLTGTAFTLTAGTAEGGYGAVWGRGAVSSFDGREGELRLEGEVTSAMLGADFTRDAATLGLMLAHSRGEGSYQGEGEGEVSSTLTGLYPYGRYELSRRVSVWGVAGYGQGRLTLTPEGQDPLETDMRLVMGALGTRAIALEARSEGGVELAVTSDAMAVRTRSEAETGERGNLAAGEADVTRLRLGLEGTWRGLGSDGGATLAPTLEVGVRHDGGDAETGFGLDVGGGLAWADPRVGLSADVRARALLTHESDGFGERGLSGSLGFDPRPDSDRGFAMTLSQTMGAQASGGMDALLGQRHLEGLGADDEGGGLEGRRLELKAGYGFAVFGDRFTATPQARLGLSESQRELGLGWRLGLAQSGPVTMELGLEGTRSEPTGGDGEAVNALMLRGTLRW